ncbi:MAG TPA: 2-C-methyl-D-erythritol 2,4-cyclodiphosphate synthase [Actinomycetota bacterium]|jgi:2-C-methyl-D-erythritol 2,4-cyclodiphosphate synthase|nr:2-C-methyl-D-erythritol 2,4-cyclodiphosphate synthase [Actinomycetota bacterium]
MRAGIGFDVHAFDAARPLVLGGVTIPGSPGLAGHSDADVIGHAIADAVLGGANLGDLGSHFPDSDAQWKDASSLDILRRVASLVGDAGYTVESVDATVLLEAPKLAPHRDAMCANIADALGISAGRVSVKATTTEGLGTVGRGEGAACMAVALLGESDSLP